MFDQKIDHDHHVDHATKIHQEFQLLLEDTPSNKALMVPSQPKITQQGQIKKLVLALIKEKERDLPHWIKESIGWGGFISILGIFLAGQIYLNEVFDGSVGQVIIGFSGVLEIGLLWLWELNWY